MINDLNHPEREWVLNQALRARTFSEIALATREMDQWVADHPDDLGIRDAYEVLANMQEIAELQRQKELNRQPFAEITA